MSAMVLRRGRGRQHRGVGRVGVPGDGGLWARLRPRPLWARGGGGWEGLLEGAGRVDAGMTGAVVGARQFELGRGAGAVGRTGRRRAWPRPREHAEVGQDARGGGRVLDRGHQLHPAVAGRAVEHALAEAPAEQDGPGQTPRPGRIVRSTERWSRRPVTPGGTSRIKPLRRTSRWRRQRTSGRRTSIL